MLSADASFARKGGAYRVVNGAGVDAATPPLEITEGGGGPHLADGLQERVLGPPSLRIKSRGGRAGRIDYQLAGRRCRRDFPFPRICVFDR